MLFLYVMALLEMFEKLSYDWKIYVILEVFPRFLLNYSTEPIRTKFSLLC